MAWGGGVYTRPGAPIDRRAARGYKSAMETDQLGQELGDQDRVLLVFDYLGPLALVSLMASRREFVKWHAKQGIVLWSALVVAYPVLHFVDYVLDRYFWSVFGHYGVEEGSIR